MSRNLKSRLAGVALTVAAGLLLTGCSASSSTPAEVSGEPVAGGTLTVARSNPFEGFELDKQTLNSSFQISQAVLEPLIRPGADGASLAPGVASSWEFNDDNTELTIRIDDAATFSDGTPVTSKDVAFSVETWQAGPNYGSTYASIESTEALDDKTIIFHLNAPNTSLPSYLSWANAGVVPADFGGRTAEEFWQQPVGAGPFVVTEWSANGETVLEKSPEYHVDGRPYLDKVVSSYASDPNSVALQLRSGELDVAEELMPVTASSLPDELVAAQPEHITPVLLMNTAEPGLSEVGVRQGIGYAIDYQAIATTALSGYAGVPGGALPPGGDNWAAPSTDYFSRDTARAQQLVGDSLTDQLTLVHPNDPSSTLMAQMIQSNLGEVGVQVELRSADPASAFASISAGDYDLAIYSYNAISPDAADPAQYVAATQTMFTGADPDQLWTMLADYEAAPTSEEKMAQVTAIQDALFEEAPFIALAHSQSLTGVSEDVQGMTIMPWGVYDLSTVWKNA